MDNIEGTRNCTVVGLFVVLFFVFTLLFAFNIYAQQSPDKGRMPRPLLHKHYGPRWLENKLRKAQKIPLPSAGKKACPPNCNELLEKARKYGSVRIIVGLNIPDLPDATRLPHAPKEEKRLLKRMSKHKITGIKKLQYTSAIGMTVDLIALEDLIANPELRNIGEDLIMRPMLPQSVPIIGADQAWASGFTGLGYTVAILDTGVDSTHPFLAGKIVSEACFSTTDTGINPVDTTSFVITIFSL